VTTGKGQSTVVLGGLAIGLLVLLGVGAGLYLAFGDDPSSVANVPKIAARLVATDFRAPSDPQTGLRPLISVLAEPTEYDAIAVGREGTLALGIRQRGAVRVVCLRDGSLSSSEFENTQAVTALAVDPEGTVYVGFRQGGYAHIATDGSVHQDATLVDGYSIVSFAFDPASQRSAVMLSGGEVRTGLRPLTRDGLHVVTMPERARVREMTYDGSGDLWVAGDAGAVYVSTDDGWDERNVMTPGRVTAFGAGPGGDVVVGQAGGQIYQQSGSGWTLIGQIGATPTAVGSDAEGVVLVAGANGSLHRQADDTNDFVEVPGYAAPDGEHAVHDAAILGPIAAFATPERVWVWDDVLWGSADDSVRRPPGAEGRVVPVGPWSDRSAEVAPLYLSVDGDDGTLRRYEAGGLRSVERVSYGDGDVSPGAFRSAVGAANVDRRLWIGGAHHALDDYGISRWDGAEGYTELARLPEESGRPLSTTAASGPDGVEVVTITDGGALYRALLSAEAPAFEELVPHARFQEHYGDDFYPMSAQVVLVGPGRVIVVHDRERVTRVDFADDVVEPLDLGDEGLVSSILRLPSSALVTKGGSVVEIGGDFSVHRWELPEGITPRTRSRRGHAFFAIRDGDMLMGGTNRDLTLLLRCAERRCARVALPASVVPAAVFFGGEDEALVWGDDGVLSVLELGTSG